MALIRRKRTKVSESSQTTSQSSQTKENKTTKSKLGNKKVVIDDIQFDSILESRYYQYLKELQDKKEIDHFELQPEFILIQPYEKYGKKYRATKYIADFKIYRSNKETDFYLVDTKGFITTDFSIKRKLFDSKYPDIELYLITYDSVTQEWCTLEELDKRRKQRKKDKTKTK